MSASHAPVLSSRFSYEGRALLLGRARLHEEAVVLTGWSWQGRHRRVIPLADVRRVEWWTKPGRTINFALYLEDGEAVGLHLKGAGLWKYEIEARAPALARPDPAVAKRMASAA